MDHYVQHFGSAGFDRKHRRLWVDGRAMELDRSGAAVLAALLDAAGEEVSKDRLLELGWPGRLVHENSLAKTISRLRHLLGRDGRALVTVHGYGYRLDADTHSAGPALSAIDPPGRKFPLGAAALTVSALIVFATLSVATLSRGAQGDGSRPVINGEAADAAGRVLWVDDNPQNNVRETEILEERKVAVYHAETTEDALALLSMYQYGAVISDMGRGERPLAGIDLLKAMRARGDDRPFILYTVHSSEAQRRLLAEAGGQGVAESSDELYAAILPLFEGTD